MNRRKLLLTGLILPLIGVDEIMAALKPKPDREPRKPKEYKYTRVLFYGPGKVEIQQTNSRAKHITWNNMSFSLDGTRNYNDGILFLYTQNYFHGRLWKESNVGTLIGIKSS